MLFKRKERKRKKDNEKTKCRLGENTCKKLIWKKKKKNKLLFKTYVHTKTNTCMFIAAFCIITKPGNTTKISQQMNG